MKDRVMWSYLVPTVNHGGEEYYGSLLQGLVSLQLKVKNVHLLFFCKILESIAPAIVGTKQGSYRLSV